MAYEESYQAFERPPDNLTLYSLIPRGIRRFFLATDVSVKPVNDTINLFMTATLPVNFAYLLRSFNIQLTVDTATDWDDTIIVRMLNHIPGQEIGTSEAISVHNFLFVPATGDPERTAAGLYLRDAMQPFSGPMWSVHGAGITFRVHMANVQAAVQAAGFVVTHVEFLEYDLTQAQRFYINTPLPTLSR